MSRSFKLYYFWPFKGSVSNNNKNKQTSNSDLTAEDGGYIVVSEIDNDKEPEYIPEGPKNALHHMLQIR